jgi:hypothetical protein
LGQEKKVPFISKNHYYLKNKCWEGNWSILTVGLFVYFDSEGSYTTFFCYWISCPYAVHWIMYVVCVSLPLFFLPFLLFLIC